MRSRTFLNVALGILALALAYHLGAQTATAQAPGNPIVEFQYGGGYAVAMTSNGDLFEAQYIPGSGGPYNWTFKNNVFGGGPTPTSGQESFGSLKARYRGEREPQGVKPSTNR